MKNRDREYMVRRAWRLLDNLAGLTGAARRRLLDRVEATLRGIEEVDRRAAVRVNGRLCRRLPPEAGGGQVHVEVSRVLFTRHREGRHD